MGKPSGINQSGFPIPPFQCSDLFLWELGGLFSLFTPRHKLLPLYIELSGRKFDGKLLRNFITLAIAATAVQGR